MLDSTATILTTAQEKIMPDAESTLIKKTVENKKHPQVVNVLKECMGTTTITNRILDSDVNLTFGKLPASAPAIDQSHF